MKKITEDEFSNLHVSSDRNSSPFYTGIINLRVGEILSISKDEWDRPKSPSRICRYIERKFPVKYECRKAPDGSGWAVKRVK